ncbi:MAG: peptidoglycan-binding protein [Oscillospiraceae bacterium]|jgi:peptidoglycan hydrolase-like protein with peptidoglycan-binding domain|nr:peptidoglycan-binding protein [Oscillospiraceae bacterium]
MFKRVLGLVLVAAVLCSAVPMGASAAIDGKTGIGLAQWALRAYNEKWRYVYGSASVGAVDCSGLVRSYCNGQGGGATTMLNKYSSTSGSISSMPRVHGLVLYASGSNPPDTAHMGVYVGKNEDGTDMAVDARSSNTGIVYASVTSRKSKPWTKWFKTSMISYPQNGWFTFNGKKFYYKDGQFVVGVNKVDGVTYDFGKSGALKGETDKEPTTTVTTKKADTKTTTKAAAAKTTTKAATTKAAATTTTASGSLKLGSRGDEVKALQKRLIELGYLTGSADGVFGQGTEDAVKAFQQRAGLTTDGVAGKGTLAKLNAKDAPKPATTTKAKPTTSVAAAAAATTTAAKATTGATTTAAKDSKTAATTVASGEPKSSETENILSQHNIDPAKFKNVHFGMNGESVSEIQTRLLALGYLDEEASGYFGAFTEKAVRDFQTVSGLTANGIVDRDTYVKLFEEYALAKPQNATTNDDGDDSPDGVGDDAAALIEIEHDGTKYEVEKDVYELISGSAFM